MSADRPARRDGSSHTTIPSKYVLVIRGHSCQSAVRLFGGLLNETAVPRMNTNVRRSPGAVRRIVVRDYPLVAGVVYHDVCRHSGSTPMPPRAM